MELMPVCDCGHPAAEHQGKCSGVVIVHTIGEPPFLDSCKCEDFTLWYDEREVPVLSGTDAEMAVEPTEVSEGRSEAGDGSRRDSADARGSEPGVSIGRAVTCGWPDCDRLAIVACKVSILIDHGPRHTRKDAVLPLCETHENPSWQSVDRDDR